MVGGIVWVILVGGPGVGLGSSVEGLVTGIAYAVCLVQWVRMTKVGLREGEKEGEVGARYVSLWFFRSSRLVRLKCFRTDHNLPSSST